MSEYLEDWDKAEYRCPECEASQSFFEIVELDGWRSVDIGYLESEGIPVISADAFANDTSNRGADWTTARSTGALGCGECTWEGYERQLKLHVPPKLGWDGKPLDKPLLGQLDLLPCLDS